MRYTTSIQSTGLRRFVAFFLLQFNSHVGQIDQIDHDLDQKYQVDKVDRDLDQIDEIDEIDVDDVDVDPNLPL